MQIDRNNLDELTARLTLTVEPADYTERVEKILNQYKKTSQYPGFRKGKAPMALIRKQYAAATAQFDAVIMPTAAMLPPNAERLLTDEDYYKSENLLALRNTRIANLLDVCSMTLPTGVPSCGIMLNGQNGTEAALLRLCAAAERALS